MSTDLSTQVVPNLKDVVTDRVRAEFAGVVPDTTEKLRYQLSQMVNQP